MSNLTETADESARAGHAEPSFHGLTARQITIDHFSSKIEQFSQSPFFSGARWLSGQFAEVASRLETNAIFQSIPLSRSSRVLDVGAGGGRWSLALVDTVGSITAVEPSDAFETLRERLSGFKNARCVHQSFEDFRDDEPYDLIIISGVLMYIPETQHLKSFLTKAAGMMRDSSYLVLREAVQARGERIRWTLKQPDRSLEQAFDQSWTQENLESCRYLEIVRPRIFYTSICGSLGLRRVAAFASHAPINKDPIFRHPLVRNLQDRVNQRFVNMNNFKYLKIANRLLRKPYSWLGMLLNKQLMTIMIFRKPADIAG